MKPNYVGSTLGMSILYPNPSDPTKGGVATVNEKFNSGIQIGAIKGAYLADTTAETVTGVELVTNGDGSSTTGWTAANATLSIVSGKLRITATGTGYATAEQYMSVTALKTYLGQASGTIGTASSANISIGTSGAYNLYFTNAPAPSEGVTFTPASGVTSVRVTLHINSNTAGQYSDFDNISVKLAEPDRSVKGKGLIVNGILTKTAVASGAGLVAWSGFSAANYLEAPYSSDLDFGTGDFSVMGWCNPVSRTVSNTLISRSEATSSTPRWNIVLNIATGTVLVTFVTSGGNFFPASVGAVPLSAWTQVCVVKSGTSCLIYINGVLDSTTSLIGIGTLTNLIANTAIGVNVVDKSQAFSGSLALMRISATAPSADQISQIYRDELPLFQPAAQCTLAGTSPAITALSFDEDTSVLHAGTSYGRSSFKGLLRVESEATTVGSPTSIAASGGHIVMGGTSAKLYTPAKYLRDELQRKDEAKKALGRIPVFLDFTATSGQTAFVATKGYRIQAVYKGGTLMRESTTGTYWTRSHDGYQETATLSVGATTGDWISMMLTRI